MYNRAKITKLLEDAERKTFHSFRHRVITMLRHNRDIDKAWVKDLVGHKHIDETDARYRAKTKLEYLKEVVEMIPKEVVEMIPVVF